eukprot:m.89290 g.89290  ORF g.89290 m.89290 type:complete len:336 (-) comp21511_c0_seq2:78-1085(-)
MASNNSVAMAFLFVAMLMLCFTYMESSSTQTFVQELKERKGLSSPESIKPVAIKTARTPKSHIEPPKAVAVVKPVQEQKKSENRLAAGFSAINHKLAPPPPPRQVDRNENPCLLSHKVRQGCPASKTLTLLVTGTGRSGTHFVSHAFSRLGFDVAHESVGKHGSVSWTYAVVDPRNEYPWQIGQRLTDQRYFQVFHVVRHPLKAIASLETFHSSSWNFIARHTHEVPELNNVLPETRRALIHWVTWNKNIEKFADWRFQTEHTDIAEICLRAGFDGKQCRQQLNADTVRKHSRKHNELTWEKLEELDPYFAGEAKKMAIRYGYTLSLPEDETDDD